MSAASKRPRGAAMTRRTTLMASAVLLLGLVVGPDLRQSVAADAAGPAQAAEKKPVDFYGDSLPAGAVARMGTRRLKANGSKSVTFSADGSVAILWGQGPTVSVFDTKTGKVLYDTGRLLGGDVVAGAAFRGQELLFVLPYAVYAAKWRSGQPPEKFLPVNPYERAAVGLVGGDRLITNDLHGPRRNSYGRYVVRDLQGKELRALDLEEHLKLDLRSRVFTVSSDGAWLVCGNDRHLRLANITTGKCIALMDTDKHESFSAAFSPDNRTLAVACYYLKSIRLWDLDTLKQRDDFKQEVLSFGTRAVAFSPDGKLAYGGEGGKVHIWQLKPLKELAPIKADGTIQNLAFSPDGKTIAITTQLFHTSKVLLWDMAARKPVCQYPGHVREIRSVRVSPDGKMLWTAGLDQSINAWDARTGRHLYSIDLPQLKHEPARAPEFCLSPDGSSVAIAWGRDIIFHDAATGKETRRIMDLEGPLLAVAYSPEGKYIACLDTRMRSEGDVIFGERILKVIDAGTGRQQLEVPGLRPNVHQLAWSPDGKQIATGAIEGTYSKVTFWDASNGKEIRAVGGSYVAFSPTDERVAVYGADNRVRLYNRTSGQLLMDSPRHYLGCALAFSPDGRNLAVACSDQNFETFFRVYDVSAGKAATAPAELPVVFSAHGHDAAVTCLTYSPDGTRLLTGSEDTTALVWPITKQ